MKHDRSLRRAGLLVRLYPRSWRKRFPDFVDVLAAELAEQTRGVTVDVARSAFYERLRHSGVVPARPRDRARSGLALVYAALIPFAGLALGMWSQLHTGLARPSAEASPALSGIALLLVISTAATLTVLPLATLSFTVSSRQHTRRHTAGTPRESYRQLIRPASCFVGSATFLTLAGWAAGRSGWFSPAAVALPHRGVGHGLTLWARGLDATITPAWIHPGLFGRMPLAEAAAALLAPVAALVATGALFRMMLLLPRWEPRRSHAVLALGTVASMLVAVAASVRWLLLHPGREGATPALARSDQLAPGHTGWTVVVVLGALAVVGLVGVRRVLRHPWPGSGDTSGTQGGDDFPCVAEQLRLSS